MDQNKILERIKSYETLSIDREKKRESVYIYNLVFVEQS